LPVARTVNSPSPVSPHARPEHLRSGRKVSPSPLSPRGNAREDQVKVEEQAKTKERQEEVHTKETNEKLKEEKLKGEEKNNVTTEQMEGVKKSVKDNEGENRIKKKENAAKKERQKVTWVDDQDTIQSENDDEAEEADEEPAVHNIPLDDDDVEITPQMKEELKKSIPRRPGPVDLKKEKQELKQKLKELKQEVKAQKEREKQIQKEIKQKEKQSRKEAKGQNKNTSGPSLAGSGSVVIGRARSCTAVPELTEERPLCEAMEKCTSTVPMHWVMFRHTPNG
jgi:hypothetical protein